MELCYRIALGIFFVIACIQAAPTPSPCNIPTEDDMGLDALHDIKCANVDFLSQAKVEANTSVAFNCIYNELERASTNCTDGKTEIKDTLDQMKKLKNCPQFAAAPSSDCQWTTTKTFKEFVEDAEGFFEKQRNAKKQH